MAGKASIPAHVIAARGRRITLLDGTTPALVYGFSSIMRLEEDFGSIDQALEAVSGSGGKMPSLVAICKVMCAGLEHESTDHGLLSDVATLRHLLDSTQIEFYSDMIGEAFELAFPKSKETDDAADPQSAESSPGPSGTTSAPSSSDAAMVSSGV